MDTLPDGSEMTFAGLRDHFGAHPALHVLQTHGMGDHPAADLCAPGGLNLKLQDRIAERLNFKVLPEFAAPATQSILRDGVEVGSYSTRVFVDDLQRPSRQLYFSCVTWGEASRLIKRELLELDGDFLETNPHEGRRAFINRKAKQFVNRSFSDPVIYVGEFGPFIRETVREGIARIDAAQSHNRMGLVQRYPALVQAAPAPATQSFVASTPMAVITDSLGSRVLFDVLWPRAGTSAQNDEFALHGDSDRAASDRALQRAGQQVRAIYMLANQLPLLALAELKPPPQGQPLDRWARQSPCLMPPQALAELKALRPSEPALTLVAFTDVNDALSYRLSDKFKQRCAPPGSGLSIVNVTLTNTRAWFGLYANLIEAHADGFKHNEDAIGYVVEGNK
ncbi:hypothetical protein [Lysobacter silvisoli]|uniref:Uncharacterized protein n=1 Tax=Lysobacter silvisoli TaxID=2293254 RepID=A0A371K4Q7_9GAMM|nr:hypothetical protein [Lysobacter silvisoli]RDZ28895.1 hypothetical protein DX914_07255 [Lysobacter silvisoli]